MYYNERNSWQVAFSTIVASDARNHTPFAVLSVPGAEDPTEPYRFESKTDRVIPLHFEKAKVKLIHFLADICVLHLER